MTDTWTQKLDYPVVLVNGVGFSVGSKGYGCCGITTGNTTIDDLREYNPEDNTWTLKAIYPYGNRAYQASFTIGNYGYVGTGIKPVAIMVSDFAQYDPSNNIWNAKAAYGYGAIYGVSGFALDNNKGYFVGGVTSNTTYEYNPSDNTWTQKANFGGGNRFSAVGFPSTNSKGYIASGYDGSNNKSDCWEYDPSNNTWTQKASLSGKRRQAVGFGIGKAGHVIAGVDVFQLTSHQEYDSDNNTWTAKASYTHQMVNGIAFSILEKGYVGTGDQTGTLKKDFFEWCCNILPPLIYNISGYVKDGFNNPIENANIHAVNGSAYQTTSDVTGAYSLDVEPHIYQITASKARYNSDSAEVDATSTDQTQNFTLGQTRAAVSSGHSGKRKILKLSHRQISIRQGRSW